MTKKCTFATWENVPHDMFAVWLESLLTVGRIFGSLAIQNAPSEDSGTYVNMGRDNENNKIKRTCLRAYADSKGPDQPTHPPQKAQLILCTCAGWLNLRILRMFKNPCNNCVLFVGISMVVCLVVSVTATSLLEVIEQIRKRWPFQTCTSSNCSGILSVLGSILSCLFIVKYDKSNDDGNDQVNDQVNSQGNDQVDRQAVTLSQFGSQDADNQTTEQRKEGQISTEPSHLSTSSFCSSRLKRGVKFTIAFLLYMGYLGGAIYGLLNTNTRLDLCTLSDSDSEWSSFCHINSVSFNQDFIVTLVVKPEKQMNINRTDAAVSELLSAAKSQNVFNPKFQINWLSAFSSNASYNKENFRESLSLFLHENKLYQNDVIHDFSENESDVRAFRIYLKTKDVLGQKDIVEVMKAVRELEDRIPFKCYFYAPVFMLYEGSFSWTADLLKTTGIAFGVAVLLLSVFSYHYRFYALLILLQALSIFIGVIGFASIWNFSLSFVTTIPMLLMMGSVVKIFVIQWDGFLILLVGYLSVVIFMLTFTFPAFIMKSVFIPYFLYCVSLLFHSLIFMPQLVLVWLKKSKYKKFHNHGLTSESETTVQHFHIWQWRSNHQQIFFYRIPNPQGCP